MLPNPLSKRFANTRFQRFSENLGLLRARMQRMYPLWVFPAKREAQSRIVRSIPFASVPGSLTRSVVSV